MSKNLKNQLFNAIESSFKEGMSKHSYKKEYGDYGGKVFSYRTRENLKDVAKDFSKFMKEHHKEVKLAKDVKKEHIKEFLETKVSSCSSSTIKNYQSRLDKIGRCCSEVYRCNINYKVAVPQNIPKNELTRTISMDKKDYETVIKNGSNCDSKIALKLSKAFGLRVSETIKIKPKDIDFKKGTLFIEKSKGGRDRTLEIRTQEQKEVLKELKNWRHVSPDEKILKVQADSVNNYLRSNLEKNGITKYSEHKTGVHSIRKMYATERYNELKSKGMNHKKAWGQVSHELGHSRDRDDKLFYVYVVQ